MFGFEALQIASSRLSLRALELRAESFGRN
jgi:hypothetical protein